MTDALCRLPRKIPPPSLSAAAAFCCGFTADVTARSQSPIRFIMPSLLFKYIIIGDTGEQPLRRAPSVCVGEAPAGNGALYAEIRRPRTVAGHLRVVAK